MDPDHVVFRTALAALEPGDQYVVVLRFLADLTQSEIAHRLGTNQVQSSRRLRHILEHLRELIEPEADLAAA